RGRARRGGAGRRAAPARRPGDRLPRARPARLDEAGAGRARRPRQRRTELDPVVTETTDPDPRPVHDEQEDPPTVPTAPGRAATHDRGASSSAAGGADPGGAAAAGGTTAAGDTEGP